MASIKPNDNWTMIKKVDPHCFAWGSDNKLGPINKHYINHYVKIF